MDFLLKDEDGKMVGVVRKETKLTDLRAATKKKKQIDKTYIELAERLSK